MLLIISDLTVNVFLNIRCHVGWEVLINIKFNNFTGKIFHIALDKIVGQWLQ